MANRRSTTRADRLAGQAASLERRRQRVADRRDAPVGVEADGDVAGERAVVLDGDLQPVAGHRIDERRHLGDEALGVGERVRGLPALVAGDVRVGAVGRERRRSAARNERSTQAWGRERQERVHRPERRTAAVHGHGVRSPRMKVSIEAEKCQGHNRCYALAPELFDVDDYGQAVVSATAR